MPEDTALSRGRRALAEQSWQDASENLSEADAQDPLDCGDLEALALARFLTGQDAASLDAWTRCYQRHVSELEHRSAARCAFWAGYQSQMNGEMAHAQGWLTRVMQALESYPDDCVERGYALIPPTIGLLEEGNTAEALPMSMQAADKGKQFNDATLIALGNLCIAHVHLLRGETERGVQLLDEVMVSITAGEVQPQITGVIYCATIIACQEIFDVRRAREWTRALSRWSEKQQGLVPFRGQCLVHRAELMQMNGDWPDALDEVQHACERLSNPPGQPALGMAYYEEGELRRLRGELAQAEAAFRHANQLGHPPQPGLALLWLRQGKTDAAVSAIRTSLEEAHGPSSRARLLPAGVEIMRASGATNEAGALAHELTEIAAVFGAPALSAAASQMSGAVALADGDATRALDQLRMAWQGWQLLGAPYQAARTRQLMAEAHRALGHEDLAQLEFDAALVSYQSLGAATDVLAIEQIRATSRVQSTPLTAREVEVLRLLATGASNRAIAVELVISEKTVARHIANIYAKLDVSSRSAATAYAYEHGLAGTT